MPQIMSRSESTLTRVHQTGDAFKEMDHLDSISRWLDEIGASGADVSAAQTKLDPLSFEKAKQGAQVSAARSRTASLLDIWASAQAHEVVLKLMSIEKYRKLFAVESMAIFQSLLESLDVEYLVTDPSSPRIVEIGAGTGQLRAWMPAALQKVVFHTEPLVLAISQFHRRWPEAHVVQAKAECLPFDNAEVGLAMGLCVLDGVDDGLAVARELARVLRPGGHFVHLLDLSTDLSSVFKLFGESALIPLPNVFSDPTSPLWPEDMFLVQHLHMDRVLRVLLANGHALAPRLARYLGVFERTPFDVRQAVTEYLALTETPAAREEFERMFLDAFLLADADEKELLADFTGQPCSSAWLFAERLARWFSPARGFEIVRSEIVTSSSCVEVGSTAPFRYESLCVGEMRHLPDVPANTLNPEVVVGQRDGLVELGVFCFVARRL